MPNRLAKTEAGRHEMQSQARTMSRPARNLLSMIDGTRAAADWVQLIHGASDEDVARLIADGLVEPIAGDATRPAKVPCKTLEAAVDELSYDQLHGLLSSQARDRLGLIDGWRIGLEVQQCRRRSQLQALALRFVCKVRAVQGEQVAQRWCRALGMSVG